MRIALLAAALLLALPAGATEISDLTGVQYQADGDGLNDADDACVEGVAPDIALVTGLNVHGAIVVGEDPADHFLLPVAQRRGVRVVLDTPPHDVKSAFTGTNFDLFVLDTSCNVLASSERPGNLVDAVTVPAPADGQVIVVVAPGPQPILGVVPAVPVGINSFTVPRAVREAGEGASDDLAAAREPVYNNHCMPICYDLQPTAV
jgi:hypothetical protein